MGVWQYLFVAAVGVTAGMLSGLFGIGGDPLPQGWRRRLDSRPDPRWRASRWGLLRRRLGRETERGLAEACVQYLLYPFGSPLHPHKISNPLEVFEEAITGIKK